MDGSVAIILDGLILIFLLITMFYATRLTMFFKNFRDGRENVELLIRDLSTTVDKANSSIGMMKKHAQESERELREVVNEAKFIADELRFMNESGDGLAQRLEKLADRNRELLDLLDDAGGIGSNGIDIPPLSEEIKKTQSKPIRRKPKLKERDAFSIDDMGFNDFDELDIEDEADFQAFAALDGEEDVPPLDEDTTDNVASFAILDRDFTGGKKPTTASNKPPSRKTEPTERFYSRAEQDLYDALQRRKRVKENT